MELGGDVVHVAIAGSGEFLNVEGARAAGLQAVHVKTPQDVERALRRFMESPPTRG